MACDWLASGRQLRTLMSSSTSGGDESLLGEGRGAHKGVQCMQCNVVYYVLRSPVLSEDSEPRLGKQLPRKGL